ncbi:hypothetical protein BdWA1_002492 [Babesia duncani]|uniref:Uncharacterized protein n=1 Tax=Babesia duncani TaxID=323732 RepID=A0AAD9PHT5_9APIC|nr:hypothetical protein BdWA1_003992 [Babesia duncani]KAK2194747.1 hypothetical protein BdWA1_003784 [Babesia duncani]KAK2195894.1 hypothetical protein BdWA1_002492 [Babesia duncani]
MSGRYFSPRQCSKMHLGYALCPFYPAAGMRLGVRCCVPGSRVCACWFANARRRFCILRIRLVACHLPSMIF